MWRIPCSPCLGVLRVAGCRTQQGSGGGFVLSGSVQSLRWRSSKSAAGFLQQKRGDGPSFVSRRNPRNMDAPMPQEVDVEYSAERHVIPQAPRQPGQYDDYQEKRAVAQRDKGVKFKSLRMRTEVKNNLMKGAFLYFILDTGVWIAAGSLLQLAGFIDVTWQTNVITSYPIHSYIPTGALKSAFLVVATSGLWAHGYLIPYRVPIICMGGLFMAARMTNAMKKNVDYMEGFKVIFPDNFLKRHALLGVELVVVFFGCTTMLMCIGFGEWVHASANETIYSYFTSYNDTLRGILGTNDWPTDESLTCASLACLGVELYTMARVRVGRGIALTLRNMMKA